MVKERRKEGVASKNTTLTHIKLSKSLQAAVTAGKVEEADSFRKQLAKASIRTDAFFLLLSLSSRDTENGRQRWREKHRSEG